VSSGRSLRKMTGAKPGRAQRSFTQSMPRPPGHSYDTSTASKPCATYSGAGIGFDTGLDTMVSWPNRDLRFRNPYPFPVSIRALASDRLVRVELLGAGRPHPVEWNTRILERVPAGERTLRFYPRYDTEPGAIAEGLAILKAAVEDIVEGQAEPLTSAPEIDTQLLDYPLERLEVVDITAANFHEHRTQIMDVETEHYGSMRLRAPDARRNGGRRLLQLPCEMLEATLSNARAIGVALRDVVSGRFVAYALGSALEDHDEEGVASDPFFGDNNTFYLHATAARPSMQNHLAVENLLLDVIRIRVLTAGFEFISALIEERVQQTGPQWLQQARVIQAVDNYLRSGIRFVYLQLSSEKRQGPRVSVAADPAQ